MTLCGGMTAYTLFYGSKQECLDEAKGLIDDLAYDQRYIFTTGKMLSFPNDAKPENMKAVNDFVREYGVFK